jgi:predicted transcriptional regulator
MICAQLATLPDKCLQQPCVLENNYVSVQSSHTICPVIWFMCPEESSQAPVKKVEAPVAATVEDKEDATNMENTPPVVEPPSKPKYR